MKMCIPAAGNVLPIMRDWYERNIARPAETKAKKREWFHGLVKDGKSPRVPVGEYELRMIDALREMRLEYHSASYERRFIESVCLPSWGPPRDLSERQMNYAWGLCGRLAKKPWRKSANPACRVLRTRRRAMLAAIRDGMEFRPDVMLPEDHYA
jgi:hypothetical protein